jgi:hypothetical protein
MTTPGPSPTPPAHSHRSRRAIVAVIGIAIIGGGAWLILRPSASTDPAQAAAVPESTTTVPPTTTTTTFPFPRVNDVSDPPVFGLRATPVRVVTEAAPLTIWTIGDSTASSNGQLLESDIASNPLMQARTISKSSTGLTRPDYYDWNAALPVYLAEGHPDAAVISFGANDAQPIQTNGVGPYFEVGSPEWTTEYTRRAQAFVGQLTAVGTRVYLTGQPVMRDPGFSERMGVIDKVYRAVAAADPGVEYIDANTFLSDPAGGYTDSLPAANETRVQVRQSDGIHLSLEGARWLARIMERQVAADFGLNGP